MTIKTKKKIQEMYKKLNCKYWQGELPEVNIHIKEIKDCYGEYTQPDKRKADVKENYHITINARLHWRQRKSMRSTLLHEMCHHAVFINNKKKYWKKEILWHGKEWRREMERVGFKKPVRATS